ncbi:MAG: hypothetical protein KJO07_06525 [Deltaproteobacteria bacterium]|nr:hypothetical protein [Deltaproteobacteria bacterium]
MTRRVTQRQFWLKPTRRGKNKGKQKKQRRIEHAIRYCIARAAKLSGVKVHIVVFLSNHYHLIVTDPLGLIPYFAEILNKNLARCVNALYGRWENLWAGGAAPSYVRLETAEAVLEESVYALTNPVKDGLVASRKEWPGELLEQPGTYKAEKPSWFFRSEEEGGKLPDVEYLELTPAPVAGTADESIKLVKDAADRHEAELRAQLRKNGRKFMGVEAILRQRPSDNPNTVEHRRRLSPTLACKDKWRRIEALQIQKDFKDRHRQCMRRWMAGERDVVFPFGTYKMRVIHRARVAEA